MNQNKVSKYFKRILQSVAFRSGYRLIAHNDPRAFDLPELTSSQIMATALYSGQIQQNAGHFTGTGIFWYV